MRRVERRHTFLRRRIPSVDDVVIQPKQAAAAGRPHTFCIRGDINRLGIRVVQIELHAMRHGMTQGRLQALLLPLFNPSRLPLLAGPTRSASEEISIALEYV